MKRIDTATVDEDLFGPGLDGFTNGDAGLFIPPTQLDASWFNNVQEEVARAIESRGIALSGSVYDQLRRVINTSLEGVVIRGRIGSTGLTYLVTGTLQSALTPGSFWFNGRRYDVTQAMIDAMGTDSPRTFAANQTTWVGIRPTDANIANETIEVAVSTFGPLSSHTTIAAVTTDGVGITAVSTSNVQPGPHFDGLQVGVDGILPRITPTASTTIGSDTPIPGDTRPAYFREINGAIVQKRAAQGSVGAGRVRELVIDRTIANSNVAVNDTILASVPVNTSGLIFVETVGHRTDASAVPFCQTRVTYYRNTSAGVLTVDTAEDDPSPVTFGGSTLANSGVNASGSDLRVSTQLTNSNETWKFTHHVRIVQSGT